MKNKKYVIYNFIVLVILSSIVGILIIRLDSTKEDSNLYIAQEKVTDECTEEAEQLYGTISKNEVATSSTELKLSPNAELVIQKYYSGCGHTVNEYAEILPEMVNKNQEEIEDMYKEFKVETFDKNKLVVSKEENGFCGEHYVLREKDGVIIVNLVNENNEETLYEKTSISSKYLTQTDLINLKDGIRVYGRENLNSFLEDYE